MLMGVGRTLTVDLPKREAVKSLKLVTLKDLNAVLVADPGIAMPRLAFLVLCGMYDMRPVIVEGGEVYGTSLALADPTHVIHDGGGVHTIVERSTVPAALWTSVGDSLQGIPKTAAKKAPVKRKPL